MATVQRRIVQQTCLSEARLVLHKYRVHTGSPASVVYLRDVRSLAMGLSAKGVQQIHGYVHIYHETNQLY